ncbi:MAG: hypothetical protein IJU94_01165 [Clostridia bacterium]|nr:hypothetical protein [Clostridia bacterium]
MFTAQDHAEYIISFINTFREHEDAPKGARELACLRVFVPAFLLPFNDDDVFAGRYRELAVGFTPQEHEYQGYYMYPEKVEAVAAQVDEATAKRLREAADWFRDKTTTAKTIAAYPEKITSLLPPMADFEDAASLLYRIGGTFPDYGKLVTLGIPGLKAEISARAAKGGDADFFGSMLGALDLLAETCLNCAEAASAAGKSEMAMSLTNIASNAPANMREALQLITLFAHISGNLDYGRLDDILAPFADGLDDEEIIRLLIGFYKLIVFRGWIWDGRVIVGGRARRHGKAADRVALLAIEAGRRCREVLPQLTLRFYDGQDPALLEKAFDNFADGYIYPMLYSDDVNIPAVEKSFGVNRAAAERYMPFGCGEYVLEHCSLGTPSGTINLLKVLEATLFDGRDIRRGKQILPKRGFHDFESLFAAYSANVDLLMEALALQERIEYDVTGDEASLLYLSMLYDDCVERGKPLLSGGVRYLGGTMESYGNVNTADSLTAIKSVVYDRGLVTIDELKAALAANFEGFEDLRRLLLDCPKYGNDDDEADAMAVRVHEQVCASANAQAEKVGLHTYKVVVINNSMNTTMGVLTGASADGRGACEPMANGNNPAGGRDVSGVTAMLNSLVKLDPSIHAGAVQNMKFTTEMFNKYREKTKALLAAYFKKGQQAMLNILNRGDLEDALVHPEKYPDLIVRVGGFAARFIELDRDVQREIVSRTLYGNDN